jgi:tRNA uridine 5-carbamoylmethylation protein Kti12
MKIIVLYGLPGIGKLTVAKELAKITNHKLFHNHLTYEAVYSILDRKDKDFWDIVNKMRFNLFKVALQKKVNLIFTTCYSGKESDKFIKGLISFAKKEKINLKFVHLICNEDELIKRISNEDRKKYNKLTSKKEIRKQIKKMGINLEIPYSKSFNINNTKKSPKAVAKMIAQEFKLK